MKRAGEILEAVAKIEPNGRSIVRKLSEVMGAVERIPKRGHNSFHNYDYVTEADLADALRVELSKRKLFVFPHVIQISRTPHDVETAKGIRKTQLTEIVVQWSFEDGESGEIRTIDIPGVGEDNVDKGFYKAFTGSEKYMLMKAFLVPTGDDPERESKTDRYDAKERQQKVAAAKVRTKTKEMQDDTLLITEWGEGFVSLSGGGLAILRVEMPPEEARRMEIKRDRDSNVVTMPQANVFQLEDFCKRVSIAIHWTKQAKTTVEAEPREPGAEG